MATRKITERRVTWRCTYCGANGNKQIETTESAERHADETGHDVFATGMLMYVIGQGTVAHDDPFKSQTSTRATHSKQFEEDAQGEGEQSA